MRRLLDSELEFFVESDFLYLPLLLDPSIEKETRLTRRTEKTSPDNARPEPGTIITHEDKHFVKTLHLISLIENYATINPYHYNRLREECLRKHRLTEEVEDIFFDMTLRKILFQIMPYFVKKNKGLKRIKLTEEETLDWIAERINIPQKYHADTRSFLDLEPLENMLSDLKNRKPVFRPPASGLLAADMLRTWFYEAIHAKVLADECIRVEKAFQLRQQLSRTKPVHIALFLYIAGAGGIELDGFGFSKMKFHRDYLIYKRTGEYVLKDYYNRSYRFPDCRVAVSTYAPLRPFVIEKYKHPFLRGFQANQEICMKGSELPGDLTAQTIIRGLEEGIQALLYGYDARRRNGYHSLDKTYVHIPTIVFEEYRI